MTTLSREELIAAYDGLSDAEKELVSKFVAEQSSPTAKPRVARDDQDLSYRATGRLIFADDGVADDKKPLHNMIVELWDRDIANPDDFLGRSITDQDGRFEIRYDPADAGRFDRADLELRVLETQHTFAPDGTLRHTETPVFAIRGDDNVTDPEYDFGERRVPYWEYDPEASTPRLHIVKDGSPPQSFPIGRALVILREVAPLEIKKRYHLIRNKLNANSPRLDEVQAAYPECLTQKLEKENPGYSRSDEYFGERLLNGMSASILDRDPVNPDRRWLHHHWNSYAQDGIHALPNVDVWFETRDEKIWPVQITLQFRDRNHLGPNPPMEAPQTYTPGDGDKWLQAKRVARVSAALASELDAHLTGTHLNVEQYVIAAYRNLHLNPIRYLLFPHLKEVVLINHDADRYLLGEHGYISRATALTEEGLGLRFRQVMGTLDWKNWSPRRPITNTHTCALAGQLFWDLLTDCVDQFFDEYGPAIIDQWYEIHRFSQDLVEHSVPMFLCKFLRSHLGGDSSQTESLPQGSMPDWFEPEERMDLSIPRVWINGEAKAVQPITLSDTADDEGIENLKQVCRYVIYHSSFMHWWSNSRQNDDCGEVFYNSLCLRYGDHGVMVPESDHSICPSPGETSEMLWFSHLLSKAAYGFITRNEEGDIYPPLVRTLRARREAFAELGIDVRNIQSRANI